MGLCDEASLPGREDVDPGVPASPLSACSWPRDCNSTTTSTPFGDKILPSNLLSHTLLPGSSLATQLQADLGNTRPKKKSESYPLFHVKKSSFIYSFFFYSDEVLLSSLDWLATCIFQTDLDLLIDLPVSVSEHCDYRRVSLCPDASCFKQPFTSAILKLWSLNQQHRDHMGNCSKYGIPLLTYQVIKHSSLCSF